MQWRMLQQTNPTDYVIATGRQESVRRFVELSAHALGWNTNKKGPGIKWEGKGLEEVGIRADTDEIVVRIDPKYFRPCEVDTLLGDPTKASKDLGWEARSTLEDLVKEMIEEDLIIAQREIMIKDKGQKLYSQKKSRSNFQ